MTDQTAAPVNPLRPGAKFIPEDEAREYSSRIEAGHILVSVQTSEAEAGRARKILIEEGARTS